MISIALIVNGGALYALAIMFFQLLVTTIDTGNDLNYQYTYKQTRERFQKIYNETIDSIKSIDDIEFKKEQIHVLSVLKTIVDKLL